MSILSNFMRISNVNLIFIFNIKYFRQKIVLKISLTNFSDSNSGKILNPCLKKHTLINVAQKLPEQLAY